MARHRSRVRERQLSPQVLRQPSRTAMIASASRASSTTLAVPSSNDRYLAPSRHDPADIVVNIHHAYRRAEFRAGHYACFHTGPSATADIEGVLIHGAQGVRSLSVLPIARAGTRSIH